MNNDLTHFSDSGRARMVDVSAKTETVRADSSLNQMLFYTGEFVYNVGCKIPSYNLPYRVERNRSIPYTRPSRFPGGGSVQQGLSAAYEFIAMFKLRCAADKRYSLGLEYIRCRCPTP